MVEHQVQDDLHAAFVAGCRKCTEVLTGAIGRIDIRVVSYIIFMICRRRRNRHQPDAPETQIVDVVQLLCNPVQITCAVSVRIVK